MNIFKSTFFTVKSWCNDERTISDELYVLVISNNKKNALKCFDTHSNFSEKRNWERTIVEFSPEYNYTDLICDKNGLIQIDFSSWSLFNIFVDKNIEKEFNRGWSEYTPLTDDYVQGCKNAEKHRFESYIKTYYNQFLYNIREYAKHNIEKGVNISEPNIKNKKVYFSKNYNDESIYIKVIDESAKGKTGLVITSYYNVCENVIKMNLKSDLYIEYRTKLLEYCLSNEKIVKEQQIIDKLSIIGDNSWYWKPLYSYYLFETIIEESGVVAEDKINNNSCKDDVDVDSVVGSIVKLRKEMFDNKGNLRIPENLKYLYSNEDKKEVVKEESNVILSSEFKTIDEIKDGINEKIEKFIDNEISDFISHYEKVKANGEYYSNFEPETIEQLESVINDMKKRVKKND